MIQLKHIDEIQLDGKCIHIHTASRSYHLMAETDEEASEWFQDVRSVAFRAKSLLEKRLVEIALLGMWDASLGNKMVCFS
mmetsp:Transcript_114240/g.179836  ORF Transcript_114240/g.179836 Transcript_114240/m.179836 type:complete len:80 (-) Transcript_114240:568-807(-)